jgi:hypothetical protein
MVRGKHLAILFLIGIGLGLASGAAEAAYYDTGPYAYSACSYPYSYLYPCDDGFVFDDHIHHFDRFHDFGPGHFDSGHFGGHEGGGHFGGGGGHGR